MVYSLMRTSMITWLAIRSSSAFPYWVVFRWEHSVNCRHFDRRLQAEPTIPQREWISPSLDRADRLFASARTPTLANEFPRRNRNDEQRGNERSGGGCAGHSVTAPSGRRSSDG